MIPLGCGSCSGTVGDDHFAILVPSRVREFFKQEIVKFDAVDVTAQQEPIRQAVAQKLRADLAPFHIILESIQIDDVSYEAGFEQQIELKVLEDEKAKTAQQAVATKSAEADQLRVETEGLAAARVVAAQAEADEIRLLGEAKAVANSANASIPDRRADPVRGAAVARGRLRRDSSGRAGAVPRPDHVPDG